MSMLSTVVMILFAYRLGQIWINTETSGKIHNLPSADEFSFMMKMCSGGSPLVLFEFLAYLSPLQWHHRGCSIMLVHEERPRIKPIVQLTAIVFSITIFLTLAVQGADVWVHKTLQSATFAVVDGTPTSKSNYSRVLRDACFSDNSSSASTSFNGFVDTSCVFGSDGFLYDPIETFATATNSSNVNLIVHEDAVAYIIPAKTSSSITFTAETIGVETSCEAITSKCTLTYPSSGYASFVCGSGYEALSGLLYSNQIFEISMLNGTDIVNPFYTGAFGCFKDYAKTFPQISTTDFIDVSTFNTGIYVGLLQSCTILACKVEIKDYIYTSRPSETANVTLLEGNLSNTQTTKALTGAISQSYGVDQLSLGVISAAVRANSSTAFADFVGLTLSQTILGQSAGAFTAGPTLQESHVSTPIGTKAELVPILVFIGLLGVLVIWCFGIAVWSIGVDRSNGAQAVKTARHGLIDITTLVADHFGSDAVYPPK